MLINLQIDSASKTVWRNSLKLPLYNMLIKKVFGGGDGRQQNRATKLCVCRCQLTRLQTRSLKAVQDAWVTNLSGDVWFGIHLLDVRKPIRLNYQLQATIALVFWLPSHALRHSRQTNFSNNYKRWTSWIEKNNFREKYGNPQYTHQEIKYTPVHSNYQSATIRSFISQILIKNSLEQHFPTQ